MTYNVQYCVQYNTVYNTILRTVQYCTQKDRDRLQGLQLTTSTVLTAGPHCSTRRRRTVLYTYIYIYIYNSEQLQLLCGSVAHARAGW